MIRPRSKGRQRLSTTAGRASRLPVVGLHLVGWLPGFLEAMDSLAIFMGDLRISLLAVIKLLLLMGLGFGLQRIASNFISGFILVFDRSIRPGDVISVGEKFGWVVALHARVWVADPQAGFGSVSSDINIEIWRQFKQEGITIPFPQ